MSPTLKKSIRGMRAATAALLVVLTAPVLARGDPIPRPEGIQQDVNFWIRVYTEVTTNEGFLHDERNLGVIYDTLKFSAGSSSRDRQRVVDERRDRHIAALRRIIAALPAEATREALSADDKRLLAMWGPNPSAIILRDATARIRFQLGQADRFREGLIRSSSWSTHIAETFANQGLPPELAVLPHVESSFNAAAYSKVGAAGLWQFMRSTGRRYMRVDDAVDERLDPYRSTEAAAQLLAYNYRVLGSWPLALTAYNHGASGMRRAKESVGTDDYVKINRTYSSRTFGFASRNFFPSFLAALTIDLQSKSVQTFQLDESQASHLKLLGDKAERLTTDLQRLAHQLHPSLLEHAGLEAAAREYVQEFSTRTGLTTEIIVRNLRASLPLEQATCLYRVLQESLENVRKHAEATSVFVRLIGAERSVGITIVDDGRGFDQPQEPSKLDGLGLTSMAERVKALHGTFLVRSKPGDGTEIEAWMSLPDMTGDK